MSKNLSKHHSIILGSIILIGSLIFVIVLFKSISKETPIVICDDYFEVDGMYGAKFNYDDITLMELRDTLPEVNNKVNGADLLEIKKGYFNVDGLGECRLYVLTNKGPFLFLMIHEKYVIINYSEKDKTEQLFNNLSKRIKPASPDS